MTADDQIVIHHDSSVDSTICAADEGSGLTPRPIRELTLADTQKFDCGSRHPARFPDQLAVPGTRMPTLQLMLDRLAGRGVILFGETKMPPKTDGHDVDPVQFVTQIAAFIKKYGIEDRFILQSADYRTIDAMHDINPRIRTCLLSARRYRPDYLGLVRQHHAACLVLSATDVVDATQIPQLQAAGISVFGNVADQESDWREYLRLGVDAMMTNDPARLIAFLKSAGVRH
jgi:glycerophosphoryl diester phosphodiesterase